MSASTVQTGTYKDLISPDTFLDDRCAAVLIKANKQGIAGWVFDIPTGESIEDDMDITDHYVESGSFVTDHAIEKPLIITLTGLIGELVYTVPQKGSFQEAASQLQSSLSSVDAYLGPLTDGATQKLSVLAAQASYAAGQVAAIQKRASNLIKHFSGDDFSETLQEKAYRDLHALKKSMQIVTVQTPWGFFGNMMIKSISPKQDQSSNDYTDFSITLKEMRFVDIKTTTFDSGSFTSAIDAQNATNANTGPVQGADVSDKTGLYTLSGLDPKKYPGLKH